MGKLYSYQKETVYEIEDFEGRALLAHEMGLGKTWCALAYIKKNKKYPALIVTPASVKYNWENECIHNFNIRPKILEGQKPIKEIQQFLKLEKVTIINYDILKYWIPYLKKCKFRIIVFDECQYLMNRFAQRTKAGTVLSRKIPECLMLSGTPLTNRPAELFPSLNILLPKEFSSFWKFAQAYCSPRLTRWGWEYKGASNLKNLHKRLLRTCMIRYRKEDVLHELPDKVRRVVPFQINLTEYNEVKDDFMRWIQKNQPKRASRVFRATALAKTGDLLRLAAKLKLKQVVDWSNRFLEETEEKLILFGVHRKCLHVLKRRVKAESVLIDGSVTGRLRQDTVDLFRKKKRIRVFIGNIKAAGVGINLVESSTVGFAELYWRPGDHTQAEDRSHRIGQTKQPWIYYFVAVGTIEEDLCKILQKKQGVINETLDGKGGGDNLVIYDELMKALQK